MPRFTKKKKPSDCILGFFNGTEQYNEIDKYMLLFSFLFILSSTHKSNYKFLKRVYKKIKKLFRMWEKKNELKQPSINDFKQN